MLYAAICCPQHCSHLGLPPGMTLLRPEQNALNATRERVPSVFRSTMSK